MLRTTVVSLAAAATLLVAITQAAESPVKRPALFFKEDWKQSGKGGQHPVMGSDSLSNPNLDIKLYVPAGEMLITGDDGNENNPTHVWMGMCTSPCAAAWREKRSYADLTGFARIRWNTKMSGFHKVYPIVKLADGNWLIGDLPSGSTSDWLVNEISFAELKWTRLDIERVVTVGPLLDKVDLTKVDEIGFADLMPGSGHGPGGWSDVAQVEVYAKAVPRQGGSAPR